MTDPSTVRFEESPPQPASGPLLQRAVLRSAHPVAEEYRVLASKVLAPGPSRFTTIGIVSAEPGEGKTTVALGLTAALARISSHRVVLLEADLREPSLESYLGLPPAGGVSEWLSGHSDAIPVRTFSPSGFCVITAGRGHLTHPELLSSDRMGTLLGACQLSFGLLVVDCPPLGPVADSVALQDLLDGFLLVVRSGGASGEAIEDAVARLKDGCIRGIVFNDQREAFSSRYKYRGRAYGSGRSR